MAGKRFERSLHTLQRQENPPCAACSAAFQARHGVAAAVYHGAPARRAASRPLAQRSGGRCRLGRVVISRTAPTPSALWGMPPVERPRSAQRSSATGHAARQRAQLLPSRSCGANFLRGADAGGRLRSGPAPVDVQATDLPGDAASDADVRGGRAVPGAQRAGDDRARDARARPPWALRHVPAAAGHGARADGGSHSAAVPVSYNSLLETRVGTADWPARTVVRSPP